MAKHKIKPSDNEGCFRCSFVFDGVVHTYRHQLTAQEVKHMKQLCVEFGDNAAEQVAWRAPIRGVGMVAENILAKAALAYIKKHHIIPVKEEQDGEVIDEARPESLRSSEDVNPFSPETPYTFGSVSGTRDREGDS